MICVPLSIFTRLLGTIPVRLTFIISSAPPLRLYWNAWNVACCLEIFEPHSTPKAYLWVLLLSLNLSPSREDLLSAESASPLLILNLIGFSFLKDGRIVQTIQLHPPTETRSHLTLFFLTTELAPRHSVLVHTALLGANSELPVWSCSGYSILLPWAVFMCLINSVRSQLSVSVVVCLDTPGPKAKIPPFTNGVKKRL